MPTIYDNIENVLGDELKNAFETAYKADLCVGYFNLRGWNSFSGSLIILQAVMTRNVA